MKSLAGNYTGTTAILRFIMKETAATFNAKSTVRSSDHEHRRKINFNISKYNAVVPAGKLQFENIMLARERAKNTKWRAIENLDEQLLQFEKKICKERRQSYLGRNCRAGIGRNRENLQS